MSETTHSYFVPLSLHNLVHVELQLPLAGLVSDDTSVYPELLFAEEMVVLFQFRREVLLWFHFQDLE